MQTMPERGNDNERIHNILNSNKNQFSALSGLECGRPLSKYSLCGAATIRIPYLDVFFMWGGPHTRILSNPLYVEAST